MQTEDGGLGPPIKGVNLVILWVISSGLPNMAGENSEGTIVGWLLACFLHLPATCRV